MSVWSEAVTTLVLRYRLRVALDVTHFYPEGRGQHVRDALARRAIREIREALRPYALDDEPHPEDMTVAVKDEISLSFTRQALVYWMPRVTAIELVGGAMDGRTVDVVDPFKLDTILIPQRPSYSPLADPDSAPAPYEPTPRPRMYGLTGWDNTERRWRFTLKG